MWKMVRAAILGVFIGVLCGTLYVGTRAVKSMYNIAEKLGEQVGDTDSDMESIETFYDDLNADASESGLTMLLNEMYATDTTVSEEEDDGIVRDKNVIRLLVTYEGDEALNETEAQELRQYVKTAVLYGISKKLGEDYNSLDISTVRNKLIMSLEYINECARESAMEWGISAEAKSTFDYIYMPEACTTEETYPAGYYEALCIILN